MTPPVDEQGIGSALESALGFRFSDPSLLELALTHRSRQREGEASYSNERLEFLGDSVLGTAVAEHLYRRYPDWTEGELTKLKAAAVSEVTLAKAARAIELGTHLRLSQGEEMGGGRDRQSILSDALEAVFGAVYLDGGEAAARQVILRVMGSMLDEIERQEHEKDYKTILQELIQQQYKLTPEYHVVGESGPDHQKFFVMEVCFGGETLGTGSGRSKKQAEQVAAREALRRRERESALLEEENEAQVDSQG